LEASTMQKLDEIRTHLVELATKERDARNDGMRNFAGLRTCILALADEEMRVKKQQKILRSLYFYCIKVRHEAIKEAHAKTFEWIFQSSQSNFKEWLNSGEGIYWIQGKAGSGKSTLMKYLSEHTCTRSSLKNWAGSHRLFIGSHFFWNAGHSLQKSKEGLLQTLLYQVLKQCPDLIEKVCPIRFSQHGNVDPEPWSSKDLSDAFDELSRVTPCSSRICLFIDGLDEYKGDHTDLTGLLRKMTSSSIKICASSRPWNEFTEAFNESDKKLKLEDLTRRDIRKYVEDKLEEHNKFKDVQARNPSCSELVEDIVEKSRGVFLWVYLVVKFLVKGLIDGDDVSDMKKRLEYLPSDLEEYFRRILNNIHEFYRDEAVRCFEVVIKALHPLPLLAFEYLSKEEDDQNYALNLKVQPLGHSEIKDISEKRRVRLNARCKDLLEVNIRSPEEPFLMYQVDFLHRAVRDFFLRTDVMDNLRKGTSSKFDTHMALCRIMVALIKALPMKQNLISSAELAQMFSFADEMMYHAQQIEIECIHEPNHDKSRPPKQVKLLDELDRACTEYTKISKPHWTNLREAVGPMFEECRQKTFLALAIQDNLRLYVEGKLDRKQLHAKHGRPLLDYALRPTKVTAISPEVHDAQPDVNMVRLLLENGADPNKCIYNYGNRTVWCLFLRLCHESAHDRYQSPSERGSKELYSVVEMLVEKNADPNLRVDIDGEGEPITVLDALRDVLNENDMVSLDELLKGKRRSRSFFRSAWTTVAGSINYMTAYS
jgi:hypothetical protein